MSQGLVTVSYIGATVLFILALGGLSNPESSRKGNLYGMIGMTLAVLATILSDRVDSYVLLGIAMVIGGGIGLELAKRVDMTEMPELVAILHSLASVWKPGPVWPRII